MAEETEGRVVQISATLRGQSRDGTAPPPENSNDERVDDGEE